LVNSDPLFFAWPICAQFNLARVCALGLTISHAFKLKPSFWQQLISVPLSEGNRCTRLRSRLPAHCVRFGTRTGWACWVAFISRPGPLPAKRHDHNTASSIWAMPCPVCHSLNARVIIVNASTCPLAVSSCVGSLSAQSGATTIDDATSQCFDTSRRRTRKRHVSKLGRLQCAGVNTTFQLRKITLHRSSIAKRLIPNLRDQTALSART
jgi:hypothetical protein